MADNSQIKEHISSEERNKWNKVVTDFNNHLGKGGVVNHALGNGIVAGFSTNDFTNEYKEKLDNLKEYVHPATHPYTMITGLSTVAHTGSYNDLKDKPTFNFTDAETVTGIRFTVGPNPPSSPKNGKEIWFNTNADYMALAVYYNNTWNYTRSVYNV